MVALVVALAALPAAGLRAQGAAGTGDATAVRDGGALALIRLDCTRVADPKLDNAAVVARFDAVTRRPNPTATVAVRHGSAVVRTLHRALPILVPGPTTVTWDGRDGAGRFVPVGRYELVIEASGSAPVIYPVWVVRLGVREIAVGSDLADAEWQMVYFKRNAGYAYYTTPAVHEYLNTTEVGELAELDLDDGSPRAPVARHGDNRQPQLENGLYDDDRYNYPACLLGGTEPVFTVRFGATTVAAAGGVRSAGYPPVGMQVRCTVRDDQSRDWSVSTDDLRPGAPFTVRGPALPNGVTRTDVQLRWRFECSVDQGSNWSPVAGEFTTEHRLYTLLAAPVFAAGATGAQYSGPWVDVVDRVAGWAEALTIDTQTESGVVEAVIMGFAGQVGPLPTAIEGVVYDCYPLGGDGGASHYYLGFPPTNTVQLSRLLDGRRNGVYVNCSDCASSTSTMISMCGVANMRLLRLGNMTLRAIRGIGAPDYTLALWGSTSNHGFSYHHIVTRDNGWHVSDACLWVDEDGSPSALPGTPGYNVERVWARNAFGYMLLSASNIVTNFTDPLPRLQ